VARALEQVFQAQQRADALVQGRFVDDHWSARRGPRDGMGRFSPKQGGIG
jgi:hypothetical protein